MSSAARRKRLEKVQKVWEDDLADCAKALSEARARADLAQAELEATRARTRAARAARANLGGASAEEWRTREAWLSTCAIREERATLARTAADRVVTEAVAAVTVAQQKIERMKLVLARLAEADAKDARRIERIVEDEASARSKGSV